MYCKASGAQINIGKSVIKYLGSVANINPNTWGLKQVTDEIRVLGVFLGDNLEVACKRTWDELENKLESKINLWRMRALLLKIVNTLLLTKLNHVLMTHHLPSNT